MELLAPECAEQLAGTVGSRGAYVIDTLIVGLVVVALELSNALAFGEYDAVFGVPLPSLAYRTVLGLTPSEPCGAAYACAAGVATEAPAAILVAGEYAGELASALDDCDGPPAPEALAFIYALALLVVLLAGAYVACVPAIEAELST